MAQQREAKTIAGMKWQQEQIDMLKALLRTKGHAVGGERHAAHAADEAVKTEHREGDVEEPTTTAYSNSMPSMEDWDRHAASTRRRSVRAVGLSPESLPAHGPTHSPAGLLSCHQPAPLRSL